LFERKRKSKTMTAVGWLRIEGGDPTQSKKGYPEGGGKKRKGGVEKSEDPEGTTGDQEPGFREPNAGGNKKRGQTK